MCGVRQLSSCVQSSVLQRLVLWLLSMKWKSHSPNPPYYSSCRGILCIAYLHTCVNGTVGILLQFYIPVLSVCVFVYIDCGVVWCGVVRCGVVWCGVVWCGVVWCSVKCGVKCGVVQCSALWCGVVVGLHLKLYV